jgi:hypothetical protein
MYIGMIIPNTDIKVTIKNIIRVEIFSCNFNKLKNLSNKFLIFIFSNNKYDKAILEKISFNNLLLSQLLILDTNIFFLHIKHFVIVVLEIHS